MKLPKLSPRVVGAILIISLLAVAALWIGLESLTLSDKIAENHITAVIQNAWEKEPGVILVIACVFSYWMGHTFWSRRTPLHKYTAVALTKELARRGYTIVPKKLTSIDEA